MFRSIHIFKCESAHLDEDLVHGAQLVLRGEYFLDLPLHSLGDVVHVLWLDDRLL